MNWIVSSLKLIFSLAVITSAVVILQSCAKPSDSTVKAVLPAQASGPAEPNLKHIDPVNFEMIPTYEHDILETSDTTIKYEKPKTQIQTPQAILHLNQVKMSKVILSYDSVTRKLIVSGQAAIFDDNKKFVGENTFEISGLQGSADSVVKLTSESREKTSSRMKPVVRAQATCLSVNSKDEPDCSRVVIDFFIAYQKKFYTEQMEIKREATKTETSPPPRAELIPTKKEDKVDVTPEVKPEPDTTTAKDDQVQPDVKSEKDPEPSELQTEEKEQSIPGRFEGQAEATDLNQLFDDPNDEDIQSVLKPATSKAEEKKDAKPKVDKDITPDITQTKDSVIRPKNQAIGFPNGGLLRNATSLLVKQKNLEKKPYFEIVFPQRERYFATYEMAEMLTRMGEHLNLQFNKTLAISDISKLKGGLLSPHLSHQIGMDADIAYPSNESGPKFPVVVEMSTRQFNSNAFSIAKTYDLLKFAFQQADIKVDRVFIDRTIKQSLCNYAKAKGEFTGKDKSLVQYLFKNLEHVNGHGDHFHLRLKCTSAHPACRQQVYREMNACD